MSQRYDVVLKALNGPLAAMGEQKFQGPLVRIGANPGPGGFSLSGYRGVDARQAVITAYGQGEATIGPVGTNQVRLAPHSHVNWREIDPLTGPEYLNEGCAIHLGPVGRGCTLEFVKVEELGQWTTGSVGSAASNVSAVGVSAPVAARKATPQRSVAKIAATTVPIGILGCFFLLVVVGGLGAVIFVFVDGPVVEKLGPTIEGDEYYEAVDVTKMKMDEKTLEGLHEPFRRFAAKPSAKRAKQAGRDDVKSITDPNEWDDNFFQHMSASVEKHITARKFFRRLDDIRKMYAEVLSQLREAGLPEAIASLPYTESRYKPHLQSWACAKGYWQFMPEVAHRVGEQSGLSFKVKDCKLRKPDGTTFLWSPTEFAPPPGLRKNGIYIDHEFKELLPDKCLIPINKGCQRDDRTDIKKSTAAAIWSLKEAWDDDLLATSGAAAQMTILSHNGGYDDSRFGQRKSFNVLPAFKKWKKKRKKSEEEYHLFYGDNIKCGPEERGTQCGAMLAAETQHYGYTILAQHVLAACYYGKNYRDEFEEFRSWDSLLEGEGYCTRFAIPDSASLKRKR
ncbi:MAG: hypothetical protein ACI9MC_000323 [Kiritimatiellia bacterium]